MLEVVLGIFVLCLAIVGIMEVFRVISFSFFYKKDINEEMIIVIPFYGHNEEAEMILRNAISKAKWLSSMSNRKIVCLDLGMDSETRKICEIISEEQDLVEIYSPEEFNKAMKQSII